MRVFLLLHDERRERGSRSVTDRGRGHREDDRKDWRGEFGERMFVREEEERRREEEENKQKETLLK